MREATGVHRSFIILVCLLPICLALPAFPAGPNSELESWVADEVRWIITKDEAKSFKKLDSDAAREEFIALFWARRDPTPATSRNEYREEYLRRLRYVDENFGTSRRPGRETDRGRVYCLLGAPTREGTFASSGPSGSQTGRGPGWPPSQDRVSGAGAPSAVGGGKRGSMPPVIWTYEKLPEAYAIPSLEVRFEDYDGFGSYALDAGGRVAASPRP